MFFLHFLLQIAVVTSPVFLLGVVLLMITRLVTGPGPTKQSAPFATVVRVFGWFFTIVGFTAGGMFFIPSLPVLWCASLAVVIALAYNTHVATQRYAMLALLGVAAERAMPLETALGAFGQERGGWMRRRAAELIARLQQGESLPQALEAVPGVLPPETVPMVCLGYKNGGLGPAIRRAIAARNLFQPVWQSIFPKIGYICFLPMAALGVITFMMLMIAPQYEKIFRDFGMNLPDLTLAVIGVCHWPLLWMPLGAGWLLLGLLFLYSLLRYTGSLRRDLPGMRWLLRMLYRAEVLDALALAAGRQQPLHEALRIVAGSHPQRAVASRLAKVCQEAQGGGDELQSLFRQGLLGAADLALLEAARRNANFAWAAREIADSNRRRFIYRTYALLQMLFPAVVLGYGILTGIIFAAMFLPLVALISNLAGGR